MKKEYVVWGVSPKHGPDDVLLLTGRESRQQAEAGMAILEKEHGCHSMRVQVIDLSRDIAEDWKRAVA